MPNPQENKQALEAKQKAEEKTKALMQTFKETRDKWAKERLTNLETAKKALQDDLTGKLSTKEFIKKTSGAYGFFGALWAKMTLRKKEAQFSHKIDELDKMIEAQKKSMERDKEREKNLEEDMLKKEASGETKEQYLNEKGDLGYHEYTGKGYKFEQARGETIAKANDEKELSGFKKDVFDRAMNDLDARVEEFVDAKDAIQDKIKSFVTEEHDINDLKNCYDNRNRIKEIQGKLDGMDAEVAANKKRLAEISKEKAALKKSIESLQKKIDEGNPELEKRKAVYDKTVAASERVEATYNKLKAASEDGRELSDKEKQNLEKATQQHNKISEQLKKMSRFYKIRRERRDAQDLDMQGLQTALEELEQEEQEIQMVESSRDRNKAAFESELDGCKKIEDSYTSELGEDKVNEIVSLYDQSKNIDLQIENVNVAKENLERDILNTDVTEFLVDNAANDTVKGISINGKEYLDTKELEEKGIKDSKLNEKSTAKIREVQKVVRALKSRDVFKHANGLNLGEYATYNEETGKFDLYQGSLKDKESFEKFKADFQKKYFTDSNVFSDDLIEKDFGTYAKTYACAALGAAAKGMKNLLLSGVRKIKDIPKKLSQIPGFSAIFGEYTEEELAKIGGDPVKLAESASNCGFVIKKLTDTAAKMQDPQMVQLIAMAKVDAEYMKVLTNAIFIKGDWAPNVGDIGQYVVAIEQSCRMITENKIANKQQLKAMKEMLKAGHDRFAAIMKQAANQSKIEEVKGIVDLSTTAVIAGAQAISGATSLAGKMGLSLASKITKGIYSAVQNKKSKEEFLNNKNVLGGIDYDKKLVTKGDFNKILKSVTGINSREDLSNALHVMDAVDLLKTAKETKGKDKEVLKSMNALGYKDVSKWNKIKVSDILKKTTGKAMDAKKTLRNATEKAGFHFGGFFQKVMQKIRGTKSGRSMINASREEMLIQNREKELIESKGVEQTFKAKGAENIYNMYKVSVMIAEKEGKPANYVVDPKTNQPLDPKENRVKLIEYFSKSSVAKAAAHMVVGGFTAEQQFNFVKTAVKEANGIAREAAGLGKEAPQSEIKENQVHSEDKIKEAEAQGFVVM